MFFQDATTACPEKANVSPVMGLLFRIKMPLVTVAAL